MTKETMIYSGPDNMKIYVCKFLISEFDLPKSSLCKFFNVSPRTIGRWLDAICDVGYYYDLWYDDIKDQDLIHFYSGPYSENILFSVRFNETNNTIYFVENEITECQTQDSNAYTEKEEMVNIQFIILPQTIVVVRDGTPLQVDSGHRYFEKIKSLIQDNYKIEENNALISSSILHNIYKFIDLKSGIEEYTNGKVKVTKNGVEFDGQIVNNTLTTRILNALEKSEGETDTLESLTNFLQLVKENPSYKAVERLYDFLIANDIRIDKDGYVLTYRTNTADYKDKHTRSLDNTPGSHLEMLRNMVNDDDKQTCSNGFHVCSIHYILKGNYYSTGDRLTLNRVHPKDFVSFPTDYNDSKARVCAYDVVSDVTDELVQKYNI